MGSTYKLFISCSSVLIKSWKVRLFCLWTNLNGLCVAFDGQFVTASFEVFVTLVLCCQGFFQRICDLQTNTKFKFSFCDMTTFKDHYLVNIVFLWSIFDGNFSSFGRCWLSTRNRCIGFRRATRPLFLIFFHFLLFIVIPWKYSLMSFENMFMDIRNYEGHKSVSITLTYIIDLSLKYHFIFTQTQNLYTTNLPAKM